MKQTLWKIAISYILLFCILLYACDPLPDSEDLTDGSTLSSSITQDTTLQTGTYRISGTVSIENNAILTIEPGTTLSFDTDAGITVSSGSQIIANGSQDSGISFTSSSASPGKGSWAGISIEGNGSSFSYCRFSYADTALDIASGSASVSFCTFVQNNGGIDAGWAASGTVIVSNTFSQNTEPFVISENMDLDGTNSFENNTHERIFFHGTSFSSQRSWSETDVPFYVNNSCHIEAPLILAQGVRLEFSDSCCWTITAGEGGMITATGTAASPVVFTSAAASPAPSDWTGIVADENGSSFTYCRFEYAETGLTIDASNTGVQNCVFLSNQTGLDATGAGTGVTVQSNTFTSNTEPFMVNSSLDIDDSNTFLNNDHERIYHNGWTVESDITWSVTSVPLYLGGYIYVEAALTIAPGVTVLFAGGTWMATANDGTITAEGLSDSRITFTSGLTFIEKGDWDGIDILGNGSHFDYCNFLYADTGLYLDCFDEYNPVIVENSFFDYNNLGLDLTWRSDTSALSNIDYGDNNTDDIAVES